MSSQPIGSLEVTRAWERDKENAAKSIEPVVGSIGPFDTVVTDQNEDDFVIQEEDYERDEQGLRIPVPSLLPKTTPRMDTLVDLVCDAIKDFVTGLQSKYYAVSSYYLTHKWGYVTFNIFFWRRLHCIPCEFRLIDISSQRDFCGAINQGKGCACSGKNKMTRKGADLSNHLKLTNWGCPIQNFGSGGNILPPEWVQKFMPKQESNNG